MTMTIDLEAIARVDRSRQIRISNQIDTINRLLEDEDVSNEIIKLHELLAASMSRCEELEDEVRELQL